LGNTLPETGPRTATVASTMATTRRRLLGACALLLLLPLSTQSAQRPAPDFTLPRLTAPAADAPENRSAPASVSLAQFRGRVVYLDFWATWCPPCRQSFPWMDEMAERYREDGLSIIAIGLDRKAEQAQRFLQTAQPGFIVAHDADGDVATAYRLRAMPTSFLIDREGRIVSTHIGFRPEDRQQLETRIQELLDQ